MSCGCESYVSQKVQPETLFIKICVSCLISDMFYGRGNFLPFSILPPCEQYPFCAVPNPVIIFL